MANPLSLNPGNVLGLPEKSPIPKNISDFTFEQWDSGVFNSELTNLKLLPKPLHLLDNQKIALLRNPETLLRLVENNIGPTISVGTYHGTALALRDAFNLIEKRFTSFMDATNFEPTIPQDMSLAEARQLYQFSNPDAPAPLNDNFPPHLNLSTGGAQPAEIAADKDILFNKMRLLQTGTLLPQLLPQNFIGKAELAALKLVTTARFGSMGRPDEGATISDVENYQRVERKKLVFNDIFDRPNIGDLEDWFTDERFAQQFFTGTNPATITLAPSNWLEFFKSAAAAQSNNVVSEFLGKQPEESLFVQDYSFLKEAVGMKNSDFITSSYEENGATYHRYGCASVCLFHLNDDGKLRPVAIIIDWKGQDSVVIFNKSLVGASFQDQRTDWPWRYAKTCVSVSDWAKHEIAVHLAHTHMIEEGIIVATHRTLPSTHPVYQLLYPHWTKTLALNAAARATLVPYVVAEIVGFDKQQCYDYIKYEYANFNFEKSYVPTDLSNRGFPPESLSSRKLHNYGYARCIHSMWLKIKSFVTDMLSVAYRSDADVKNDPLIAQWCQEIRGEHGARIGTFPVIQTFSQLVDAATMCIHIASPQHTAVNYVQNYFLAFVPNKPSCLYAPLPQSLAALQSYQESDLVKALPINHPRQWLLSSHLPYLLSFKPGDKESLISYAYSKWHLYYAKTNPGDQEIRKAAEKFYNALQASAEEFKNISRDLDEADTIPYAVLDPVWNAVSILI